MSAVTPVRVVWFLVAPLAGIAITAGIGALDSSLYAYRLYRSMRRT